MRTAALLFALAMLAAALPTTAQAHTCGSKASPAPLGSCGPCSDGSDHTHVEQGGATQSTCTHEEQKSTPFVGPLTVLILIIVVAGKLPAKR